VCLMCREPFAHIWSGQGAKPAPICFPAPICPMCAVWIERNWTVLKTLRGLTPHQLREIDNDWWAVSESWTREARDQGQQ